MTPVGESERQKQTQTERERSHIKLTIHVVQAEDSVQIHVKSLADLLHDVEVIDGVDTHMVTSFVPESATKKKTCQGCRNTLTPSPTTGRKQ